MTEKQPDRFRLGRTIALAGVVFVISLAIISMALLGFGLIPEILPTLFPSTAMDQQTVVDNPSNDHPSNTIKNSIDNDFETNNADH